MGLDRQPHQGAAACPSRLKPIYGVDCRRGRARGTDGGRAYRHHEAARGAKEPAGNTLKERAHQLSVYLEAPVYDRLRDIAYEERTKLHPLILEAIDLLLKKRARRRSES